MSAYERDAELLVDLAGEPVVDFAVPWYGRLRTDPRVEKIVCRPPFPGDSTSVLPQVTQQLVPLHLERVPA